METPKSDFVIEVVQLGPVEKHPNADSLSMTLVLGNPVIFRTGDFVETDLVIYVPVDSICPVENEHLRFLGGNRVKAKRLRGIYSQGLIVPLQALPAKDASRIAANHKVGENVQELLGITKWLSPTDRRELRIVDGQKKQATKTPGFMPSYGLDNLKRFGDVLKPGDRVVLTEKIHGCNARYCFKGGKLYVGSHRAMRGSTTHRYIEAARRAWTKVKSWFGVRTVHKSLTEVGDIWWEVEKKYDLRNRLAKFEGYVFYGEIYGQGVQDLVYDAPAERKFRVFDIRDTRTGKWLGWYEYRQLCSEAGLPAVPAFRIDENWSNELLSYAEGESTLAKHVREGFVVRLMNEEHRMPVGRVSLKCVGEGYHLRKGAE